jgi:hypothetical protein
MNGKHSESFVIETSASEQQATHFDNILMIESALFKINNGIF